MDSNPCGSRAPITSQLPVLGWIRRIGDFSDFSGMMGIITK